MDAAMEPEGAWEQLHGVHQVPKTYVPPFMQADVDKQKQFDIDEIDAMVMEAKPAV